MEYLLLFFVLIYFLQYYIFKTLYAKYNYFYILKWLFLDIFRVRNGNYTLYCYLKSLLFDYCFPLYNIIVLGWFVFHLYFFYIIFLYFNLIFSKINLLLTIYKKYILSLNWKSEGIFFIPSFILLISILLNNMASNN